jgi:GNAT superfamily N-acetyltransferase
MAQILAFIRALAAYERAPHAAIATEADLLRDGFGPKPFFFCLIAEQDGQPAGFALYFFSYSTWMGRPSLYLEDIFVQPEFRGLGIGMALLKRVAAIAVEKGCQRLEWAVLDWNTPAIDFYRAAGAEFLDEWRNMRVTGEALERLAGVPTSSQGWLAGASCAAPTLEGNPAGRPIPSSAAADGKAGDRESQSTDAQAEAEQ